MLDLTKKVFTGVIRTALAGVIAWAVSKGYLSENESTQAVTIIGGVAAVAVWSVAEKYFENAKFFQIIKAALQLPPDPTIPEMKAAFADPTHVTPTEQKEIKKAIAANT